jgi:SET domain-containing protein
MQHAGAQFFYQAYSARIFSMEQKTYVRIIKKGPKGHSRGVFAKVDIRKGEVIEVCPVIAIPKKETKLIDKTFLNNYYFLWGRVNQPAIALGYGSLYNHSYDPNAEHDENIKKMTLTFTARRNIKKGEEITHNYNGEADNMDKLWFPVKGNKPKKSKPRRKS